jgi:exosortase
VQIKLGTATRSKGRMKKLPPHLRFALLFAISLAIWWYPLVSTFLLAAHDDEYTHIFLILPVSVALIFLEWRSLQPSSEPNVPVGSAMLLLALLIGCFSRLEAHGLSPDLQLSLSMAALVTWWIAAFVFCFGTRVSRLLVFPLCFLYWLVPIPEFVLSGMVSGLQRSSAWTAHALFTMSGVPVTQDGVLLSIPGVTIEVAKECSSIRSTLMLVVTSMVLTHLFLRSIGRKIFVVLAAIPLSIARNGFRIFTLSMLGMHVDPGFLFGSLHQRGGILFFVLALAVILLLLWLLRRTEDQPSQETVLHPTRG